MCKFKDGSYCRALSVEGAKEVESCDIEHCKFFKTPEQAESDEQLAFDRLKRLNPTVQRYIAEKYYRGKFPWLDELEKKQKAKTKG